MGLDTQSWKSSTYTNRGLIRELNEDSILDLQSEHLWIVADGMGGHSAGDYASQHLVDGLAKYRCHEKPGIRMSRLQNILECSNEHFIQKAVSEHLGIIGSTVAILNIGRNYISCSWSGDSRIYRLRSGKLNQLTRDHNYGSLVKDRDYLNTSDGVWDNEELLTKAIGGAQTLQIEHCWFSLELTDKFLLCTDGLFKEVKDDEIEHILARETSAENVISSLSELYITRGARDNIGLIYVYFE